MEIEITMKYNCISIKMAKIFLKIQKIGNIKCWRIAKILT
jgi:hypothetical protein